MNLTPRVMRGNAKDIPLADGSVHCVVTSPPYWGLRAYGGDPGMIGLEPTFDDHLGNLVEVFREVWRVLRDDGTLWLNYGDAYAGSPPRIAFGDQGDNSVHKKDRKSKNIDGLKPKDLMMMPARVAMALQADGWWLRSEIVWHKPNPMPESVTDRPTSSHEKVFLMTKKPRYFYDADAVREPYSKQMGKQMEKPYTGNAIKDYNGSGAENPSDVKRRVLENAEARGGANLRNVWKIPTHGYPGAHFATFPPALAKRCILAGTSAAGVCAGCGAPWVRQVEMTNKDNGEGKASKMALASEKRAFRKSVDQTVTTTGWLPSCTCDAGRVPATVFDPFGGSGTVGLCAEELGRRSALLDINPEYCTMARQRIDDTQPMMALG